MKYFIKLLVLIMLISFMSCNQGDKKESNQSSSVQSPTTETAGGQESVKDDDSQKDIVKIAVGSKDHTTLVAALKQAEYVNDMSNAGPFTVFAPTNEAFNKLPKGTVEELMKDAKKEDLRNILEYHVALAIYKTENMEDGQVINMANLGNVTISVKDGKVTLNNSAHIIVSIPASNGIIHVIDEVLLPPKK